MFDDVLYLELTVFVVVENMFVDGVDEVAIEGIFVWILLWFIPTAIVCRFIFNLLLSKDAFVDDLPLFDFISLLLTIFVFDIVV